MSFEQYFTDPRTLQGLQFGPLSSLLPGFAEWLSAAQIAADSIKRHLSRVSFVSNWLALQGVDEVCCFEDLGFDLFFKQNTYVSAEENRDKGYHHSTNRFLAYLLSIHHPAACKPEAGQYQNLLKEYLVWMKDVHDITKATESLWKSHLKTFFQEITAKGLTPQDLTAETVEQLFLEYARDQTPNSRRSRQATLRSFFRFCFAQGHLSRDLSSAVPALRSYALSRTPRGISAEDEELLVGGIDTSSEIGIRDYAAIDLLRTYGIRTIQALRLRLDDIDWNHGQIRFPSCKRGKEVVQPLTRSVGESLLRYLQEVRPPSCFPEVFLNAKAPRHPLTTASLANRIRHYAIAAGLDYPRCGGYLFRHAFATRLLANKQDLKTIADMLGHRLISTTFQYTKVDFSALKEVAMPWPEVLHD